MTDEKWDIATGKLFDQRAYDIQTAISGLDEGLEVVPGYIKQAIKINEIKLVLTDKSYALNFNVEVATEPFKELVEVDAKLHVNFALTASYAKSKVTVTLPDLSQAVDLTDSILSNGPEAGADE